jgi:hypothetical protein
MPVSDPGRSIARTYVTVACPCGRLLRAKAEMAGSEISCWECHRKVVVPCPRAGPEETARALRRGWDDTFRLESLGLVFLTGALVAAVLSVPGAGVWLGTGVLVAAAAGYGELVRRGGLIAGDRAEPRRDRPRRLASRALATVLFGTALAAPYLLSPNGVGHAARVVGLGWLPVFAGLIVFPSAVVVAFARDRSGPLGVRRVLTSGVRHPVAACAALAVLPLAAAVAEGLLFALANHFNMLCFLLLDLFPKPEAAGRVFGIPAHGDFSFGVAADERFLRMYAHRLGQGYTLLGAVPPSLSLRPDLLRTPYQYSMTETGYLLGRFALTQVAATVLLAALSLQARWLALIAALEAPGTKG